MSAESLVHVRQKDDCKGIKLCKKEGGQAESCTHIHTFFPCQSFYELGLLASNIFRATRSLPSFGDLKCVRLFRLFIYKCLKAWYIWLCGGRSKSCIAICRVLSASFRPQSKQLDDWMQNWIESSWLIGSLKSDLQSAERKLQPRVQEDKICSTESYWCALEGYKFVERSHRRWTKAWARKPGNRAVECWLALLRHDRLENYKAIWKACSTSFWA